MLCDCIIMIIYVIQFYVANPAMGHYGFVICVQILLHLNKSSCSVRSVHHLYVKAFCFVNNANYLFTHIHIFQKFYMYKLVRQIYH